jgi:hypothetical protein
MKKFFTGIIVALFLIINTAVARADTVNMINGTVLKGNVVRVTSRIINVKTKQGFRKFNRNQVLNNRDFLEVGFRNTKIIAGTVFMCTKYYVHIYTPEGILEMPRWKVRNIVLGHTHEPEEQLQIQLPEQVMEEQKNLQ